MQRQLGFGNGDRCVHLTPTEWTNGYTIYAFKVTDCLIGSGTKNFDRGQLPVFFHLKMTFLRLKTRTSRRSFFLRTLANWSSTSLKTL